MTMNNEGNEGSGFMGLFIILGISLFVAFLWNKVDAIKKAAHYILDPTAGALLNLNLYIGMLVIVFVIAIIMTFVQKYGTDQKTLKEIKSEQKKMQEEMKKFRHDPQKMMEFNNKVLPLSMKMMRLSMRGTMYTAVPLILFFRWFMDYFTLIGDFKFFGFLNWFWFYFLGSLIFSSILRKIFDVV